MAQKWPEMAKNVYICDKRSPKRQKIAKYTELPKFDKYSSFGLFPAIGPTVQGCVIVALQGCVIVVLQGCVIVALRASECGTIYRR
jgi:hypothetical protein